MYVRHFLQSSSSVPLPLCSVDLLIRTGDPHVGCHAYLARGLEQDQRERCLIRHKIQMRWRLPYWRLANALCIRFLLCNDVVRWLRCGCMACNNSTNEAFTSSKSQIRPPRRALGFGKTDRDMFTYHLSTGK